MEKILLLLLDNRGQMNLNVRGLKYSPLHVAAQTDESGQIVHVLCRRMANPNSLDANGETPLHVAATVGSEAAVEVLVGHCASASQKNKMGARPATLAAMKGHKRIAERLSSKNLLQASSGGPK